MNSGRKKLNRKRRNLPKWVCQVYNHPPHRPRVPQAAYQMGHVPTTGLETVRGGIFVSVAIS